MEDQWQHFVKIDDQFEVAVDNRGAIHIGLIATEHEQLLWRRQATQLRDWLDTVLRIKGLVSS